MRIAWITDSTSSLTTTEAETMDVFLFHTLIQFDDISFRDGIDLSYESFYAKLRDSKNIPTTSQPQLESMVSKLDALKGEYDIGIAVTVSSKLSGTLNGVRLAAEMADFPVVTVDSKAAGPILIDLINLGKKLELIGAPVSEIEKTLNKHANQVGGLLLVGNLEQLTKGGRISKMNQLVGSMLNIKPVLTLEEGLLVPKEKIRTYKKAERRIFELLEQEVANRNTIVYIIHANAKEKAEEWKRKLGNNVTIKPLSTSIGVHVGSDTIGFLWMHI